VRGIIIEYSCRTVYVERKVEIICPSEKRPTVTRIGMDVESSDCGLK
jgi:hypothetical protein